MCRRGGVTSRFSTTCVSKYSGPSSRVGRAPFGPKCLLSRGAGRACATALPPAVVRLECRLQYIRGGTATSGCIVGPSARAATCHDIQTLSPWGFPLALICSAALMRSRPTSAWTGPKPPPRLSCTGSSRKSARLPSETVCSGCGRGQRPTCAPREDTDGQPFSVFQLTTMSGSSPSCLRSRGCHTDC